jgi:hypothetical protein
VCLCCADAFGFLLQRHKIVAKAGGHFTLMVVGESGVGKTTRECRRARLDGWARGKDVG